MSFLFQSWPMYKDARELRKEVNKIARTFPPEEKYLLTDQSRRAALSIVLEIAEGSNRITEKDKSVFINRAFTSLNEVLGCCDCALDDEYINQEKYDFLYAKIENLAKQLRGMEKHLGPK